MTIIEISYAAVYDLLNKQQATFRSNYILVEIEIKESSKIDDSNIDTTGIYIFITKDLVIDLLINRSINISGTKIIL